MYKFVLTQSVACTPHPPPSSQANILAHDRFAAAACLAAVKGLADDPMGRRRLLDPRQYLGVRPPESCVEGMFVGLAGSLRAPDARVVSDAAHALRSLLLSQVPARLCRPSSLVLRDADAIGG